MYIVCDYGKERLQLTPVTRRRGRSCVPRCKGWPHEENLNCTVAWYRNRCTGMEGGNVLIVIVTNKQQYRTVI